MAKHSEEKRTHALSLMSAPENLSVAEVAARTGVPEATLYHWRNQARSQGLVVPGDGHNPAQWRSQDKFAVVIETAGLSEAELAQYCRKKGLHVEQVGAWRRTCEEANAGQEERVSPAQRVQERKRMRELEKELRRKEKALAEAAALLVLSRKLEALGREDGDA
jgi:transposase-like protein